MELYFVTVMYACGHEMLRAKQRGAMTLRELAEAPREIMSPFNCRHCNRQTARVLERRMEKAGKL